MQPLLRSWALLLPLLLVAYACDSQTHPEPEIAASLETAWSRPYNIVSEIYLPPQTFGDSLVLFTGEANLTALRLRDGSIKWKSPQLDPAFTLDAVSLISDGTAIYGTHLDRAQAWSLETGEELWRYQPVWQKRLHSLGRIAQSSNYVYAGGDHGYLFVLDKASGALVREQQPGLPRAMAVEAGRLYMGQGWVPEDTPGQAAGRVMAVDAQTGDSLWSFETRRGGFYRMRPLVENDRLYIGSMNGYDSAFFALDAETGQEIWRNEDAHVVAAAHSDDALFYNHGVFLGAIDKATGRTLWRVNLDVGHGESQLIYYRGHVYHPKAGYLFVLDAATGEIVAQVAPPDETSFWEVGAGGGLVLAQSTRQLVAYKPFGEQ